MMSEVKIFQELGEEGIEILVKGFYKRVRTDDVIGPMYPEDDWEGAEKRLRDFLIFRFGGPARYIQERGHPRLRMRHSPYSIGSLASQRWVDLMRESADEMTMSEEVREQMMGFLAHVATFLQNCPAHG